MKKRVVSYAQNREDIIISAFFPNKVTGFYVDVGAANPDLDSVTKYFYNAGWTGINIEPIGHIYKALQKRRPKDTNINAGISDKAGTLTFREYASDGFSTFSKDMHELYDDASEKETQQYYDYEVEVLTLAEVFSTHKVAHIDFLKVDVEGYEYEVLNGNDWNKYRPKLICIEANHVKQNWRPLLKSNKYELAFNDGLNEYYCSDESGLVQSFDYVTGVINKEPIVNYRLLDDFEDHKKTVSKLKGDINYLKDHINNLEAALYKAHIEYEEISSVRKHIKKSVNARLKK